MKDGSENKFYTVFFLSFPVTAVALPAAPEACLIEFRIGCKWVRHGFVLACAHCQVQGSAGTRKRSGASGGQKFSLFAKASSAIVFSRGRRRRPALPRLMHLPQCHIRCQNTVPPSRCSSPCCYSAIKLPEFSARTGWTDRALAG